MKHAPLLRFQFPLCAMQKRERNLTRDIATIRCIWGKWTVYQTTSADLQNAHLMTSFWLQLSRLSLEDSRFALEELRRHND